MFGFFKKKKQQAPQYSPEQEAIGQIQLLQYMYQKMPNLDFDPFDDAEIPLDALKTLMKVRCYAITSNEQTVDLQVLAQEQEQVDLYHGFDAKLQQFDETSIADLQADNNEPWTPILKTYAYLLQCAKRVGFEDDDQLPQSINSKTVLSAIKNSVNLGARGFTTAGKPPAILSSVIIDDYSEKIRIICAAKKFGSDYIGRIAAMAEKSLIEFVKEGGSFDTLYGMVAQASAHTLSSNEMTHLKQRLQVTWERYDAIKELHEVAPVEPFPGGEAQQRRESSDIYQLVDQKLSLSDCTTLITRTKHMLLASTAYDVESIQPSIVRFSNDQLNADHVTKVAHYIFGAIDASQRKDIF